jgi:hypothetical protein
VGISLSQAATHQAKGELARFQHEADAFVGGQAGQQPHLGVVDGVETEFRALVHRVIIHWTEQRWMVGELDRIRKETVRYLLSEL